MVGTASGGSTGCLGTRGMQGTQPRWHSGIWERWPGGYFVVADGTGAVKTVLAYGATEAMIFWINVVVCAALTLYCAAAILPFSSTTNVDRMTP